MAEEKGKVVKLEEKTVVYGTGKSYMKRNKEYKVHPILAEKLSKSGKASATKLK